MTMGIGEGISAAKLALDAGKLALDELRRPSVEPDKVRTHLIAMQDHVLSTQRALTEAEDENRQLRRQIEDLERARMVADDMEFQNDGGFYIRKSERDAGNAVAYCATCYGESHKLVPLRPTGEVGTYHCIPHKTIFKTKAGIEAEQERRRRMAPVATRSSRPWL